MGGYGPNALISISNTLTPPAQSRRPVPWISSAGNSISTDNYRHPKHLSLCLRHDHRLPAAPSPALLGIDQRKLADLCGLSLPTIQRMEASDGVIRGNVDSLMKLAAALDAAGIELIADNAVSAGGGRGVRLKAAAP